MPSKATNLGAEFGASPSSCCFWRVHVVFLEARAFFSLLFLEGGMGRGVERKLKSRVWTPIPEASPGDHAFSILGTALKGATPRHKFT